MCKGIKAVLGGFLFSFVFLFMVLPTLASDDPCANGHTIITTTTKATQSQDGKIVKSCSVCKTTLSTVKIYKIASIKLNKSEFVYNKNQQTPKIIVKDSKGRVLKKDTYYKVTYQGDRKNIGTCKVNVQLLGNYAGQKTLSFTIRPKGTSIKEAMAEVKKIQVTWKKQTVQTDGYQVQYSTDRYFKNNVGTKTIKNNKKTSTTIKNVKSGKTYFLRIRTYKQMNSGRIYSEWHS